MLRPDYRHLSVAVGEHALESLDKSAPVLRLLDSRAVGHIKGVARPNLVARDLSPCHAVRRRRLAVARHSQQD